jgi:hypothetical protein
MRRMLPLHKLHDTVTVTCDCDMVEDIPEHQVGS